MKTALLAHIILSLLVLKSRAQFGSTCLLAGELVSCNNPIFLSGLSFSAGTGVRISFQYANLGFFYFSKSYWLDPYIRQQRGKTCYLDGHPVSCDDPNYLQLSSDQHRFGENICYVNGRLVSCKDPLSSLNSVGGQQQQKGKRCFLDGNPVSCNDPLYINAVAGQQNLEEKLCFQNGNLVPCKNLIRLRSAGQHQFDEKQTYVGQHRFEEKQCLLNGSPVLCTDPLYLKTVGKHQNTEELHCFLNGQPVSCNDPAYLSAIGDKQPLENRKCYLNGSPVPCDDQRYLKATGYKQFEVKRCFLNANPVSCDDPQYLKSITGKEQQQEGSRQCYLNGNPIPCDDTEYLKAIGGQQVLESDPKQCLVDGSSNGCDDSLYLTRIGGGSASPSEEKPCSLNGGPVSCSDPTYILAAGGKQHSGGNLRCFLNGRPISCDDTRYLEAIAQQIPQGTTVPPGERKCILDSFLISCKDPKYLKSIQDKPKSGRMCYVDGSLVPCDKPLTVNPATTEETNLNLRINENQEKPGCYLDGVAVPCNPSASVNQISEENPFTIPLLSTEPAADWWKNPAITALTASEKPTLPPNYPPIPKCGRQLENSIIPLIENGDTVALGDFPWVTAVYDKTRNNHLICSGTIITPYVVLSAAHCFFDDDTHSVKNASNYMIAVGKVSRDYNKIDSVLTKHYEVERIIMEGFYGAQVRYLNDIAILQTKTEIHFSFKVHAVCIRFKNISIRPGVLLHAAGWGLDENHQASQVLKSAKFPYLTQNDCIYSLEEDLRYFISSDKFCVHHVNGTSLNAGDSGGGLTIREESDKLHYIVGLVSFKTNSAESRVSVISNVLNFKDFIVKHVREIHAAKNYDVDYLQIAD